MSSQLRAVLALLCALAAVTLTVSFLYAIELPWWQEDGVEVCVATNAQENPQLIPDGSGAAS